MPIPNQIFLANFQQQVIQSIYDIEESELHKIRVNTSYIPNTGEVRTLVCLDDHSYVSYNTPANCDSLLASFIACSAFDVAYPRTHNEYAKWHIKGDAKHGIRP